MLVDTREVTIDPEYDEPRFSQVLPPVEKRYPLVGRIIEAINMQELPFEDSLALFIYEMWTYGPKTTRERIINALGPEVEQAIDQILDPRTIKRAVDRVFADTQVRKDGLDYERGRFEADLDRLGNPYNHKDNGNQ